MFFPFDPYLLKRSSRFLGLKTSYVVWRHGHARGAAAAARGAQLHAQEDSDDEHGEEEGQVESSDTDGEQPLNDVNTTLRMRRHESAREL